MTFEQLKQRVPSAVENDWTQHANGGGWKHKTAIVPDSCHLEDMSIVGDYCTLGDDCTNALYLQPSNGHAITVGGDGYIQIGCERHTADWWVSHYAEVGAEESYTDAQISEYGWLIGMSVQWLELKQ